MMDDGLDYSLDVVEFDDGRQYKVSRAETTTVAAAAAAAEDATMAVPAATKAKDPKISSGKK